MMGPSSGSGSCKGGGFMSSSNLSALAPPFKVDKSYPKPNPTNPSMNFSEVPMYGTVFDPAGPFWNSSSASSASALKYAATAETVGANTTSVSSPSMYGYPGSESNNSSAGAYYGSPPGVAFDSFSYDHYSNIMSGTASGGEAAKPCYPPYLCPSHQNDGYTGMGAVPESGYDLLSNSGSANLSGYVSPQVDHAKGAYGSGEYKPKWADIWIGSNDGELKKWTEYAQGFGSKNIEPSGLSSNKSHIFDDGSRDFQLFSDGSNKSHPKPGACLTQATDSHGKVSSISQNCYDIFGGAFPFGNLVIDQPDCKSSFDLNVGAASTDCSNLPNFVSASTSKETPHLQEPVLESVTSFSGSQKAVGAPLERQFSQTGSFVFGCTSASSTVPTSVSKLPFSGSSFSAERTILATKVNSVSNDAVNKSNISGGYGSSCQKEPLIPLQLKSRSSVVIRRPVAASSGQIGETMNQVDDKDASSIRFMPQVTHQRCSDGLGESTDDAETVDKHMGWTDAHNTAEDSPCWKGASSTRSSPFELSENKVSDFLVEKLDAWKSASPLQTHSESILVENSDPIDISAKIINKNNSQKRAFVSSCPSKDHEDYGSLNHKPLCFDLNSGDGLQFLDDCQVNTEDFSMLSKTRTESDSQLATEQIFEDDDASVGRNKSETASAEKDETCPPVVADSSGVPLSPFNIGNDLDSLPRADKLSSKYCQLLGKVSDPIIDVDLLLKTMGTLSEMFRCYCFSNPAAAAEKHSDTVKQILDNLTASMSMMAGPTISSMMLSSQGTLQKETPAANWVNEAEAVAAAIKICRRSEDILDSSSFKHDSMTQAVKKILHENFHEEEVDQQKLLYKNLWLEAEAALCTMTAEARLHRMKLQMIDKKHASTTDKDSPASSKISSHMPSVVELASNDKESPALVAHDHESPGPSLASQCSDAEVSVLNKSHAPNPLVINLDSIEFEEPKSSHANDVETSVMARYQVLRDRAGFSDSQNYQGDAKQSLPEENYLLDKDSHGAVQTSHADDVDNSGLARYQILKCPVDNSGSLNYEGNHSSEEENLLPENDLSNPESQLSNSLGVTDDEEASVMARFRIIQRRFHHQLASVDKGLDSGQVDGPAEAVLTQGFSWSQPRCSVKQSTFGPYPDLSEDEDVREFGICADGNKSKSKIFEGWYGNDCSASDWEHVSKEDLQRAN